MRRLAAAALVTAMIFLGFVSPAAAQTDADTYTPGAVSVLTVLDSGITTISGLETGDWVGDVTISAADGTELYTGPVPASGTIAVSSGGIGAQTVFVTGSADDGSELSASTIKTEVGGEVTTPAPAPTPIVIVVQQPPVVVQVPVVVAPPAPAPAAPAPVAPAPAPTAQVLGTTVTNPAVVVAPAAPAAAAPAAAKAAAAPAAAKKAAPALAVTGTEAGELALLGGALIALGGVAVVVSRRRQVEA